MWWCTSSCKYVDVIFRIFVTGCWWSEAGSISAAERSLAERAAATAADVGTVCVTRQRRRTVFSESFCLCAHVLYKQHYMVICIWSFVKVHNKDVNTCYRILYLCINRSCISSPSNPTAKIQLKLVTGVFFLSSSFVVAHTLFACQRWGLPHRLAQCATSGKELV